jgi:hypothetical protein
MNQISISSFEPQIVLIDLIAHGRPLRVHIERSVLEHALKLAESSVDLSTAVEQHIEAIRDIAWAQHNRTHEQNIVLSAEDLKPLSIWAERTGPPVIEQVPEPVDPAGLATSATAMNSGPEKAHSLRSNGLQCNGCTHDVIKRDVCFPSLARLQTAYHQFEAGFQNSVAKTAQMVAIKKQGLATLKHLACFFGT